MNSFAPVDPALIDVPLNRPHDGYPDTAKQADTFAALKQICGSAARDFPDSLWIDPQYRADKAAENDKYKTWPHNYIDRFTNQDPTDECTCHALTRVAEACLNRQRGVIFPEGPKRDFRYEESAKFYSTWLAPLSIYAEANPRQWGGANCLQVLEIAIRRGFLPEKIQPREYGFKHAIQGTTGRGGKNQSSGQWLSVSQFPSGWQETAKHFKPLEVIVTNNWEHVICLVLHGYAVEVGRKGHAIPYTFWNVKEQVMGYVDSYDVVRYDSLQVVKQASDGAFAIASMTTPDDWTKPAGEITKAKRKKK